MRDNGNTVVEVVSRQKTPVMNTLKYKWLFIFNLIALIVLTISSFLVNPEFISFRLISDPFFITIGVSYGLLVIGVLLQALVLYKRHQRWFWFTHGAMLVALASLAAPFIALVATVLMTMSYFIITSRRKVGFKTIFFGFSKVALLFWDRISPVSIAE